MLCLRASQLLRNLDAMQEHPVIALLNQIVINSAHLVGLSWTQVRGSFSTIEKEPRQNTTTSRYVTITYYHS